MQDQQKPKLFREKSLEAIESPEALNDYLRVTSPGVWLVMAAVITLLVGLLLWSILGRIDTTMRVAVEADNERTVCYVPYDALQKMKDEGKLTIDGKEYSLQLGGEASVVIVSEETNPYLRVAGGLQLGDVTVQVPVAASLAEGVYSGTIVTDRLQPITLLIQ